MKLTNIIRDSFVNAAMQDVPTIDYRQKAIEVFKKAALDAMPASVARIYQDPKTSEYINKGYIHYGSFNHYIPSKSGNLSGAEAMNFLGKENCEELEKIQHANKAQTAQRNELRANLRSVAYACTTRKQLLEALPEFEKYLPSVENKTIALPAVSNLVSAFVKAGWPKNSPKLNKAN